MYNVYDIVCKTRLKVRCRWYCVNSWM